MTDVKASMIRHIFTSIISGVVVAGIIGGIGYVSVISSMQTKIQAIAENDRRQDGEIAEMQRERADLAASMKGVQTELRNLNANFERLERRLIRQEDRTYPGGR